MKKINLAGLSILIILFVPAVASASGFRDFLGTVLGGVAGLVCLILGWVIFPFTLSLFQVASKSPSELFFSRLSTAGGAAILGFFLVFGFVSGQGFGDKPRNITKSNQPVTQTAQVRNTEETNQSTEAKVMVSGEQSDTGKLIDMKISDNPQTIMNLPTQQVENVYVKYVHAMVNAINEGDFGQVSAFLLEGSPLWNSQIALVNNLVQKGITENVVEAHVIDIRPLSDNSMVLKTKETITIRYPSGKTSTKSYYWNYKAIYSGGYILFSDIEKSSN